MESNAFRAASHAAGWKDHADIFTAFAFSALTHLCAEICTDVRHAAVHLGDGVQLHRLYVRTNLCPLSRALSALSALSSVVYLAPSSCFVAMMQR